jgi:excisionase family DNA binding protein
LEIIPIFRSVMPTLREFEKWLTTGEAASRLGKSPQGIKWMLEARKLRGARTRLGWLIDPASVAQYEATARERR